MPFTLGWVLRRLEIEVQSETFGMLYQSAA
jgi:hypothetical protein